MTDARVSQARVQVLLQPKPDARVSQARTQVLLQPAPPARVSQARMQVLITDTPVVRSYVRTAGSTKPVKMKQPDGSWWPLKTIN
jgi:hypothetical protein